MTSERTADADADVATPLATLQSIADDISECDLVINNPEKYDVEARVDASKSRSRLVRLRDYVAEIDRLAALVAQHRPPTVRELQDVIANHVRNLEPVATSRGVALVVHAFLTEREEGMQNETRPPGPGEYVDPQPAAVDVAGDEREHVLSKDCWCNPTVESIEDDSIEHAQMLAQTDE